MNTDLFEKIGLVMGFAMGFLIESPAGAFLYGIMYMLLLMIYLGTKDEN